MEKQIRIAFFPYSGSQENPYQDLMIEGLGMNGIKVMKIPGRKLFALLQILRYRPNIIHIFWPHDLYIGKNKLTQFIKRITLLLTLPLLKTTKAVYDANNIVSHITTNEQEEIHWMTRILSQCKGVVFTSESAASIFKSYYPLKHLRRVVIPHVHYRSVYPDIISAAEARTFLKIQEEKIVFLVIGRLQAYKGIEDIIKIYQAIATKNTILLIAGKCSSNDYYNVLLNMISVTKADIRFIHKYIPANDLQYYFKSSNAVVYNYKDIPLSPGSIIMALGFGACIIAPKTPVILETAGPNAELFEADKVGALEKAFLTVVNNPKGHGLPLASFINAHSPKLIGAQLKEFYSSL